MIRQAVSIIDCMTKGNTALGSRAWVLLERFARGDPTNAVQLASREIQVGSHISQMETVYCGIIPSEDSARRIIYENSMQEIACAHISDTDCSCRKKESGKCTFQDKPLELRAQNEIPYHQR